MRPQHTFARRARVAFRARPTPRVAFVLVFAAVASAFMLAPLRAARADDDVERSVALMAKIGFAGSPSFSPDGSRVAFVTNVSGSPQVWTILASGGYPTLVTAFDDPVGFVTWSPGGEWLEATEARFDPTRPYRVSLDGDRSIVVFFYDGPIARSLLCPESLFARLRFRRLVFI